MRNLVRNGQLELVNGGFSSTDEACPTYDLFINNYMTGKTWIADNFGEEIARNYVKTGW